MLPMRFTSPVVRSFCWRFMNSQFIIDSNPACQFRNTSNSVETATDTSSKFDNEEYNSKKHRDTENYLVEAGKLIRKFETTKVEDDFSSLKSKEFVSALVRVPHVLLMSTDDVVKQSIAAHAPDLQKFMQTGGLQNFCVMLEKAIDNRCLPLLELVRCFYYLSRLSNKRKAPLFEIIGEDLTFKMALYFFDSPWGTWIKYEYFEAMITEICYLKLKEDKLLRLGRACLQWYCKHVLNNSLKLTTTIKLNSVQSLHRIIVDLQIKRDDVEDEYFDMIVKFLQKTCDNLFQSNMMSLDGLKFLAYFSDILLIWQVPIETDGSCGNWKKKFLLRFIRMASIYKNTKHWALTTCFMNFTVLTLEDDADYELLEIFQKHKDLWTNMLYHVVPKLSREEKTFLMNLVKQKFEDTHEIVIAVNNAVNG